MYTTKSFCHVDTLVSNVPGINSTLGEVTSLILSFSREIGKYANSTYPNLTLYTPYSKTGEGADATSQAMTSTQRDLCLQMCNYVVSQITNASGQIFQDVLQTQLQTFAATIGLVGVVVGPVNQHLSKWGPDFIRFQLGSDTSQEHTIWFSTTAMESQYTEYEIVVVPPFAPLDNFFTTPGNVNNLLNASTQELAFERADTAANGKPPTKTVSKTFSYYNPQNSSQTYPTRWVCLIYGPAGNNTDAIKDAISSHILANSTRTRDQWMALLPDIFKRTEFIIAPLWANYAIEPFQLFPQGVRSPVLTVDELYEHTKLAAVGYQAAHVEQHVTVTSFNYTSIAAGIIGNTENRDAKYSIKDYYPDYFVTPTTSPDFNRMSAATQAWVVEMNNMLSYAETMTSISSVPQGYNRVTRGGMVYITKTINNVAFLVAVKSTMLEELGL